METTLTEAHDEVTSSIDKAFEGIDAHYAKIADLSKQLGITDDILPKLNEMNVNNTTGTGFASKTSSDGNFKAEIQMDANGNVVVSYLQKQSDGSFKEIGEAKLEITTATSSLRGYDYSCSINNHIAATGSVYSSANWA